MASFRTRRRRQSRLWWFLVIVLVALGLDALAAWLGYLGLKGAGVL